MDEEWITTPQCAKRRGVSRATIYNAVKSGLLPAKKVGRDYLIKVSDCDAFSPNDPRESGKRGASKRWGEKEEK